MSEILKLIWRAALGLALFLLLITAQTIKGQAQQAGPSTKERANTEDANTPGTDFITQQSEHNIVLVFAPPLCNRQFVRIDVVKGKFPGWRYLTFVPQIVTQQISRLFSPE